MKRKNFKSRPQKEKFSVSSQQRAEEISLGEINLNSKGKAFIVNGLVEKVVQTGGPTLFSISDGTGLLALKGFVGPGERAFPEIEEGDSVNAIVKINEYNDAFEGEIKKIKKLTEAETKEFKIRIEKIQREGAKPLTPEFLIKSSILDKLRPNFIKAATEIRLAVMQNRPIIVRHHNDADGYASGYSLERAILPLIEKQHGGGKSAWEFFSRAPCAAPFYEIDDSIRDTANSLRNVAKFSNKMPLVIIADNGSSEQDLIAIQQGKVHGMDFIVIDHHQFDKDVISKEVLVHITPFLVGEDGSHFSAGMLCSEFARFISNVKNIEQIPAMAAMADRIDLGNPDAVEQYVKLAEKSGYSRQLLSDIATVIDFVSAKLRFMEAREFIEVIFGEPRDKQKELVKLLAPYIRNLEEKGLEIAKSAAKIEELGETHLQSIFIEEAFPGFGFYPKPGKVVGLVHDYAKEKKSMNRLVSVGIMRSAITIRATDEANFSVHELLDLLHKKLPAAFADGGGHKNAGSINFIPSQQEPVVKLLKDFIKSR